MNPCRVHATIRACRALRRVPGRCPHVNPAPPGQAEIGLRRALIRFSNSCCVFERKPAPDLIRVDAGSREEDASNSREEDVSKENSRGTCIRDLAARTARGLQIGWPSKKQRAQGEPGVRYTRSPRAKDGKHTDSHHGFTGTIRLSLREWF